MKIVITVKSGVCADGTHPVGQTITLGGTIPEGFCSGAWGAIFPYLMTLKYGGDFPWEKEKGVVNIHCPDPDGIVLEVRRVED